MELERTGALIAQARKERNLTQREVADALHVTVQAVSKWERGLSFPDVHLLEPLSEVLGLTVPDLLSGKRGEPPVDELLHDTSHLAVTCLLSHNFFAGLRVHEMGAHSYKRSFFKLAALFIALYLPMHFLYFYLGGYYSDILMLAGSIALGLCGAIWGSNRFFSDKSKSCWRSCLYAFFLLYAVVLGLSTWLFYFVRGSDAGILQIIFYYFPQMLILIFMLPGVVAFFLVGVLKLRLTQKSLQT